MARLRHSWAFAASPAGGIRWSSGNGTEMSSTVVLATDERGMGIRRHFKGDPDIDVGGGPGVEALAVGRLRRFR